MNKLSRQTDNAALIVRYLAANGPSTQTQLVNDSHLRRTSVFNIFEYLEQAGLIAMQHNVAALHKGRPCNLWSLQGRIGGFMTVYAGKAETVMQLSDFAGNQTAVLTEESLDDFSAVLERIVAQAQAWHSLLPLRGLVVMIAGRTDFSSGKVMVSRAWKLENYPLRDILQQRLEASCPGIVTMIENNARMAAWGQRIGGSCIGIDNYISLSLMNGRRNGIQTPISIGSGLVLSGRLYRGQYGGAGELDDACYRWFSKLYADGKFPVSLQELDKSSRAYFATRLGESFAHLVNYLAPQRLVVIFENDPPAPDFFTTLRREIQKGLIYTDSDKFPVELAIDGSAAVMRGGLALLREHYFAADELIYLLEEFLP